MVLTKTPICNFGEKPNSFKLKGTDGKIHKFEDHLGKNGTLIMFICNHCPYVKHVNKTIVNLANKFKNNDINFIAISSNDIINYPEDSPELMKVNAFENNFIFPYLYDESQEIAKKYDAACTPDFYLYDRELKLIYRGQLDDSRPGNGIECNECK